MGMINPPRASTPHFMRRLTYPVISSTGTTGLISNGATFSELLLSNLVFLILDIFLIESRRDTVNSLFYTLGIKNESVMSQYILSQNVTLWTISDPV